MAIVLYEGKPGQAGQPDPVALSLRFTRVVTMAAAKPPGALSEVVQAIEEVLLHCRMSERMRSLLEANLVQAREYELSVANVAAREKGVAVARGGVRAAPHGNHGDNLMAAQS